MTQGNSHSAGGNPYGNQGGRWPPKHKMKALYDGRLTYDEIAQFVFTTERGWEKPPARSSVKYRLDLLGFEPRRMSHRSLLPWKVRPEHNNSELRHMLQAESRKRQGKELSDTDRKLVSQLHDHLFGRGRLMVVSYHPEVGFGLVPREDYDEDIIRLPRSPRYVDDGLASHSRRGAGKEREESGPAGEGGGASARMLSFGTG